MQDSAQIGIIGGSGVYEIDGVADLREMQIETPFGKPSDTIKIGKLAGKNVAFLPRHGKGHTLLPSEIPHRANIWAMKKLGVRWLICLSAVGSLKEELEPGDFVFPDQFFDRTKKSAEHTFFGEGIVAHVSFGKPVCSHLQTLLYQSARAVGVKCHWCGTYVNIEGPAFSTKAESNFHRNLGFSVVGMTSLAEAKLAREAEISYATISMVTDYDCWRPQSEDVNVEEVLKVMRQNKDVAQKTILHALTQLQVDMETPSHRALDKAVQTPKENWPPKRVDELEPILKRFL